MFGKSVDLAIPSGPPALPGLTSDKTLGNAVLVVWLCDCRHRQSGVLFWPVRNIGRGAG
ncbi:MAG: hypothetical protein GDA36_10100 [Rhodobacteraceae bacterium]|nr:hypothetical protein [Paracoccaceae bacterium]